MTTLGIIGIILSGAVAVFLLMGGIYALIEKYLSDKQLRISALIEKYFSEKQRMIFHVIDYTAVIYPEETRKLFQNIMKDSAEAVPNMVKGMYKTFEEDEEL